MQPSEKKKREKMKSKTIQIVDLVFTMVFPNFLILAIIFYLLISVRANTEMFLAWLIYTFLTCRSIYQIADHHIKCHMEDHKHE